MNEGIGSRACAAMTDCSSDLSRQARGSPALQKRWRRFSQYSAYIAVAGLNSIGRRECNLLEQFHPFAGHRRLGSKDETGDVAAGGVKLATKPLPIGSATSAKTMGMVRVF